MTSSFFPFGVERGEMWWSRSTLSIKSIPATYCKSEKKLQGTVGAELFLGVRSPRGPINPKKYIGSWKWSTYGKN